MNIAIIAAAGAGTRMASDQPKQFLLLAGTPVIIHTLKVFEQCESINEVIVVCPQPSLRVSFRWRGNSIAKVARVVPGGVTRADSVKRGLMAIRAATAEIVAVHDGVRPFVTVEEIDAWLRLRSLMVLRSSSRRSLIRSSRLVISVVKTWIVLDCAEL